ncbi:hypothetical protein [Microbacterium hydrothermale]|uniref:hypothetical protein n=1 Tax=Microbacterium hydrothermale TaxID=857427 RepID=UPI0010A8E81B|nr:hypothetical protein [Microbacterium hydrothermale]
MKRLLQSEPFWWCVLPLLALWWVASSVALVFNAGRGIEWFYLTLSTILIANGIQQLSTIRRAKRAKTLE